MTARARLFQTGIATALWGLGMHFLFDWPREDLLAPMLVFGCLYWVVSRVVHHLVEQRREQ